MPRNLSDICKPKEKDLIKYSEEWFEYCIDPDMIDYIRLERAFNYLKFEYENKIFTLTNDNILLRRPFKLFNLTKAFYDIFKSNTHMDALLLSYVDFQYTMEYSIDGLFTNAKRAQIIDRYNIKIPNYICELLDLITIRSGFSLNVGIMSGIFLYNNSGSSSSIIESVKYVNGQTLDLNYLNRKPFIMAYITSTRVSYNIYDEYYNVEEYDDEDIDESKDVADMLMNVYITGCSDLSYTILIPIEDIYNDEPIAEDVNELSKYVIFKPYCISDEELSLGFYLHRNNISNMRELYECIFKNLNITKTINDIVLNIDKSIIKNDIEYLLS